MIAATVTLAQETDPVENETWFLLRLDGATVGYVDVIDCGHEIWVLELAVHPGHRGRGLAARLLNAVFDQWPDVDVALSCDPFTPDGHGWPREPGLPADGLRGWYEHRGFRDDSDEDDEHRMIRVAQDAGPQ